MNVQVQGYNVLLTKNSWSIDEIETANCLGFTYDGRKVVSADMRTTAAQSLHDFMNKYFYEYMTQVYFAGQKAAAFINIRSVYKAIYQDFLTNYYPRLGYKRELYAHQKQVLSQMMHKKYSLLAYDMGTGKTLISASMSKIFSIPRTIIIGPALVKWNWYRDMCDEWGYNPLYWTILDSKKSKCLKAFRERFVVCNYEMIPKFFNELIKSETGHIIIDECHLAKNSRSGRHKSVARLIKAFPNARVTLLSGTPVTNRVNDMFAYLKLCNHPLGKNHKEFLEKYTNVKVTRGIQKVSGSRNLDDLKLKVSNFVFRKRAEECVDLPDLIIKNYYFDFEDIKGEYEETLSQLFKAKEDYDHTEDEKQKREITFKARTNIHTLNRIVACAKVPQIIKLIDSLHEAGRKAIVFSSYTHPLELIEDHYRKKCVRIDGSVDSHSRDQLIEKFKHNPDVHVFVGNVKAAGVGINLVNANDVIFTNFPFTPDDLEQPYKRSHRIGQKNKVNVYYTICEGTIDEHIYKMIVDKSRDINFLIDGEGKKGVVDYSALPNMLFNSLIKDYKKTHGIEVEDERFVSVR